MTKKLFLISFLTLFGAVLVKAQTSVSSQVNPELFIGKDTVRVITTAMPFLTIAPDARSGAMGDVGVAISPDANSIHWNPAKLTFLEEGKDLGFSLSYTPWLRKLVNDMSLSYLTGYKKISKQEVIGLQLLYFNLGSIQFTDNSGNPIRDFKPQEYSVGATYSRKLSDHLGVALNLKFIHSNLSGNLTLDQSGTSTKAGNAGAGDVSLFYNRELIINAKPYNLAFGAMISNIGNKVSYTNNDQKNFIPVNLRLGTAVGVPLDEFNKITFALDLNKLMVPTPPLRDSTGKVIDGKEDKNKSLISGMIGSFGDAPNGLKEEIKEFMISTGVEYTYRDMKGNDLFSVRSGFFHENKYKGNRRFFTVGFGLRYNMFGLDFAYLIPLKQNNPLAETLRFTLHFNFKSKAPGGVDSVTE
ncbi:MAG: type IX secretion system outer membrane channel protein PorV [Cytophagaceae bacterium]|nr:type IX secretion system outer membrane channel protein PorV [Cytophagaceae bacterium]